MIIKFKNIVIVKKKHQVRAKSEYKHKQNLIILVEQKVRKSGSTKVSRFRIPELSITSGERALEEQNVESVFEPRWGDQHLIALEFGDQVHERSRDCELPDAAGRGSCAHFGPMRKPFVCSPVLIGEQVSSALRSPSCGWRMRSVEGEVAQRPVVPESLAFTFSHTSRRVFQNVSSAFVLRHSSSNQRTRRNLTNTFSKILMQNYIFLVTE